MAGGCLLVVVLHALCCTAFRLRGDLDGGCGKQFRFFPHTLQALPTPIAYYNFDSYSGTSVAPTIGSVTAILVNGASIVSGGVLGHAVSVTRHASSYVDFGASLFPSGPFSVQVWVQSTDTSGGLLTFHATNHRAGWFLGMGNFYKGYVPGAGGDGCNTGNGQVEFWVAGPPCSGQSAYVINDGHWHQVVGVYDGSVASIYLDGTLQSHSGGGNSLIVPPVSGTHMLVGAVYANSVVYNSFTGLVDELKMYNVALTAAQVSQLFYTIVSPSPSPSPKPSTLPTASRSQSPNAPSGAGNGCELWCGIAIGAFAGMAVLLGIAIYIAVVLYKRTRSLLGERRPADVDVIQPLIQNTNDADVAA